jgi:hypothetical protein
MRLLFRVLVPCVSLAVGVAVVALPGGCNKSSAPGPATVRGRVMFQGRPVVGGLVVFAPDPARGFAGKPARGETGPDGSFALQLDGSPHVPPGWYRVAIADAALTDPASTFGKPVFPPQLGRPDRSGLVREVVAGRENVFEFGVEVPNG